MNLSRVEIDGRRWYRGEDGKLYPSQSSVLDILFPNSKGFIPEHKLAMGTLCHEEMAKALLARVQPHNPYTPHADPEVALRIANALTYLDKHMFVTEAIESPILFMGVGMTPDHTCKEVHPDGQWIRHLHDWKFAEAMDEQYFYQAELYSRAELVQKATIIQINRKGEVFPHKVWPDAERWELLKSAINCRHFLDRKMKRYAI